MKNLKNHEVAILGPFGKTYHVTYAGLTVLKPNSKRAAVAFAARLNVGDVSGVGFAARLVLEDMGVYL